MNVVPDSAWSQWGSVFTDEEREIYNLYRRRERPDLPWDAMALLVVDVTNAFLGANAPTVDAARAVRTACGAPAWASLSATRTLLDAFHAAGRPVVFTRASSEAHIGGPTIGVSESGDGNEIAAPIRPVDGDVVIEKARASAFFATPLTTYLVRSGVRGLVIVGGSTSGCVRASVLDASSLGFGVAIAHDGCFDRSQLSHAVALYELGVKYAAVLDADTAAQRVLESSGLRASRSL
jgi:nicotinamidase-related amidase